MLLPMSYIEPDLLRMMHKGSVVPRSQKCSFLFHSLVKGRSIYLAICLQKKYPMLYLLL